MLRVPNLLYKIERSLETVSPEGVSNIITKIDDMEKKIASIEGIDSVMTYEELIK